MRAPSSRVSASLQPEEVVTASYNDPSIHQITFQAMALEKYTRNRATRGPTDQALHACHLHSEACRCHTVMTAITDVTCIIPSTLIAIYNSIELYRTVQLMIMSSRAKSRAGKSYIRPYPDSR
jgi:hypothetical protein